MGQEKKIKRHSTTTFPSRRVGVSVCVCVFVNVYVTCEIISKIIK